MYQMSCPLSSLGVYFNNFVQTTEQNDHKQPKKKYHKQPKSCQIIWLNQIMDVLFVP